MKGLLRIKTDEQGKQIVLAANVASVITVCNIEDINTDFSTFTYNAETGEVTILRKLVAEIQGTLFLVTPTFTTVDLTIHIALNGTPLQIMYTGLENQRKMMPYIKGFEAGDVLTFTVTCPYDETIETDTAEHYITIKRFF